MVWGVALAVASAVAHAAWNTVVKRVSAEGLPALWAYSLAALVVVLPAAAAYGGTWPDLELLGLAAVSTVLHTTYAVAVQQAYRHVDVSLLYPVSRGLAPVLVALAALAVLGQALSLTQWAADVLRAGRHPAARPDHPARTPPAAGRAGAVPPARPVALLAVLIPASYLLGLYATQHAPVPLVAALRSSSLVWAAVAAAVVLREPVGRARVLATGLATASLVAMVSQSL